MNPNCSKGVRDRLKDFRGMQAAAMTSMSVGLSTVAILISSGCSTGSGEPDVSADPDASDHGVVVDVGDAVVGDFSGDGQVEDHGDPADAPGDTVTDSAADSVADSVDDTWDWTRRWAVPSAQWSECPDTGYPGGQTLAGKAAYYDWIVPKIHQVPTDAPGHETYSTVYEIVCDGPVPTSIVDDAELPACVHTLSENNGLWTGLYVASQAFRYAATGDESALAQLRRTLNGTYRMMKITGKPGLFTRDMRDPSLPQQYCIEQEPTYAQAATDNERYSRYVPPDENMYGNQFVRVDTDGCFLTWDLTANGGAGGWKKHENDCTDPEYAGFCWQCNASKDEYSGHMFAAGIVARLVPAEGPGADVHEMAVDILRQVARHLIDHDFWITDWDGRKTRFGSSNAMSLDESPGSNAIQALDWIRTAATVTGDPEITAAYYDCLLQMSGELQCIDQPFEFPADYRTYLDSMGLAMGCGSNYDTINIALLNWFNLVWFEPDRALRDLYRDRFRKNTEGPDSDGRNLWNELNPFMNFALVSRMEPDSFDAAEVEKLVGDAVCTLKRFHTDNIQRAKDSTGYGQWCTSERHGSLAEAPVPIEERCASIFEWWGDPNERESCGENLNAAQPPAGFLLPYWMGRYFGFIPADL